MGVCRRAHRGSACSNLSYSNQPYSGLTYWAGTATAVAQLALAINEEQGPCRPASMPTATAFLRPSRCRVGLGQALQQFSTSYLGSRSCSVLSSCNPRNGVAGLSSGCQTGAQLHGQSSCSCRSPEQNRLTGQWRNRWCSPSTSIRVVGSGSRTTLSFILTSRSRSCRGWPTRKSTRCRTATKSSSACRSHRTLRGSCWATLRNGVRSLWSTRRRPRWRYKVSEQPGHNGAIN